MPDVAISSNLVETGDSHVASLRLAPRNDINYFNAKVKKMSLSSRYLTEWLNESRIEEEASLYAKSFVATIAKAYRYSTLAVTIVGLGMGYFLSVPVQDPAVGMIFGTLGIVGLLILPTCFTYRCHVDQSMMKESYFILCFRVRKEVLWKDIAYKRIRRDSKRKPLSIRLYDRNKKKLISFDNTIAGFGPILRMAKNISALKR